MLYLICGITEVPIILAVVPLLSLFSIRLLFLICSHFYRTFIYTLQHHALFAFRKILVLLPSLLHVFRAEGAWDFIFSENFFYFGLASLGSSDDSLSKKGSSDDCNEQCCDSNGRSTSLSLHELEALQIEVVSFVEFAATLTGSSHNLVSHSIFHSFTLSDTFINTVALCSGLLFVTVVSVFCLSIIFA